MPINIVKDTYTLLMAVNQLPPVHSFLADRYFPTNAASDVFSTTKVIVEYKKGKKKIAPFVSPRVNGMTILRDGYTMRELAPLRIAPKRTLTIDELKERGFGEALFTQLTPEQREAKMTLDDINDLRQSITIRKEEMCAQVMFNNKVIMKEYVDDKSKPVEKEVAYYEGTNEAVFTPAANWDTTEASGKQIYNDLFEMAMMLKKNGMSATDVLVSQDVAYVMMNNEYILKMLDNRRVEAGFIQPEELAGTGATKIMTLNINGVILDIITYVEEYEDVDGNMKTYIPAKHICVTAPAAGRTVYGAVTQMEQSDGRFHTYVGQDVPKYIADANTNTREVTVSSKPLPIPNNMNCFIVAKVLA
jgi:hypothetical protein